MGCTRPCRWVFSIFTRTYGTLSRVAARRRTLWLRPVRPSVWFSRFDIARYEHLEQLKNGDINWLIEGKFMAFSGPLDEPKALPGGGRTFKSQDYVRGRPSAALRRVMRRSGSHGAGPTTVACVLIDAGAVCAASGARLQVTQHQARHPVEQVALRSPTLCCRRYAARALAECVVIAELLTALSASSALS